MGNPLKKTNRERGRAYLGSEPTQLDSYPSLYECLECGCKVPIHFGEDQIKCARCGFNRRKQK